MKNKFVKIPAVILVGILFLTSYIFSVGYMPLQSTLYFESDLKLLSSFSTSYKASIPTRKNNIAIASKAINGKVLYPNDSFSFNEVVGARTKSKGYQEAKIIVGGSYVDGFGGGVCQVSTTLYNSVVLANLPVIESHPHTLQSGYVLPSFDAMVNYGVFDLKFYNNTNSVIYIKSSVNNDVLTVKIYGKKLADGISVRRVSHTLKTLQPPKDKIENEDILKETLMDDEKLVEEYTTFPKSGLVSVSYREVYRNGKLIKREKLRSDRYMPIQGVKKYVIEKVESEIGEREDMLNILNDNKEKSHA